MGFHNFISINSIFTEFLENNILSETPCISDLCTLIENMIDHKGKKTQMVVCGDFTIKCIDWEDKVCVHGQGKCKGLLGIC